MSAAKRVTMETLPRGHAGCARAPSVCQLTALQWVAERLLEGSSVFVNKATQETGVNDVPLVTTVIH